ncbi:MAG TPA: 50S ribosomal protein L3 N(5)-glutamine methyltransferase [Burkholderiales bacterium]
MTLAGLIARVERRLAAAPLHYGHGTDNAHDEAAWLVLRGLALPFDADLSSPVDEAQARRIERLAGRRIRDRVPTAYLLREAWLAGVPFYVDPRVIVPRSHIAELLPALRRRFPAARRILDLCTGSGCLAVLAARRFPSSLVDAADISPAALAVARKNVARHRLGRRVRLVRSNLFDGLQGRYDLILSNPPYVAAAAMAKLPPEYRQEPRVALAGGSDGLDLVARVVAAAPAHLAPRGALVCEVGESHPAARRRFRALRLEWLKPEVFLYAPAMR